MPSRRVDDETEWKDMTTLYARTSGQNFSFDTQDEYPHISSLLRNNIPLSEMPFHVLRLGEKRLDPTERLLAILKFALTQFDFEYETKIPTIIGRKYEKIELDKLRVALINFDDFLIASTLVVPKQKQNISPQGGG